jgi:hypothetical protein
MRHKLLFTFGLLLSSFSMANATEAPEEFPYYEGIAAFTENGESEVIIAELFPTDSTDATTIAQEIVDRMSWDDDKSASLFTMEELGDSIVDTSEEWFVQAGVTDTQTDVTVYLTFHIASTDENEILDLVQEKLAQVTLENVLEHLSVYEKETQDSTVYGSIIISDFFGSNDVFDDVDSGNDYYDAIAYVYDYGIVEGYEDGTYRPDASINRAEFTKILLEAKYPDEMAVAAGENCFSDVAADQWYAKYVCYAKTNQIVDGYDDGTFKPDQYINIAEALKITLNVFFTDIPETDGEWYQKYWDYADSQGLLLDEWGSASTELTRGAMAELIYRIED